MTDKKAFRIEDLTLGTLTFDDMTLGDMEDIMAAADIDLTGFGGMLNKDYRQFPPKALSAFLWVENRRNMEGLTLEDCRSIPGPKLIELLAADGDDDDSPKEPLTSDTS